MATPLPQPIPHDSGIRFRLQTLLAATACAALIAAIAGHFYRATPPGSRAELLALWAGAGIAGLAALGTNVFKAYRRAKSLGPLRYVLSRSQAHTLWVAVVWDFQIPVRAGLPLLFMGGMMFVLGTMSLVHSSAGDRDEAGRVAVAGVLSGVLFWLPLVSLWKGLQRHLWIELREDGLLAEGQTIPWSSVTRSAWHFMHPQRLLISTWSKPYAAEVEASQRAEVEAFLWARCTLDDETMTVLRPGHEHLAPGH